MGDLSWRFDEREYNYIKEVLDSGFASGTSGNMNTRLERAFCERFNVPFSITCNSGTTTLHTALWALGVRHGDEVITTPLTVISCMNAILYCGAIPVFADIDPETFLIDPDDIKRRITPKTKAVMPVHLYGQVCDMTRIMEIARENGLGVLEDCAQCYLGEHNGQLAGTIGDFGSWSFENSKHITTGDGGILSCNDETLGDSARKISCQGFRNATAISGKIRSTKDMFQDPDFKRHSQFGFMYRLPEVAAAMAVAQIEKVDWFVEKREAMAAKYHNAISANNCEWLVPQKVEKGDRHSYYAYAVLFERNDISWMDFRSKYMEFGGDGIYAAWTLCYLEDSIPDVESILSRTGLEGRMNTREGNCPVAEGVQKKIMQFTTNQKDEAEMDLQADALNKTITYFSK